MGIRKYSPYTPSRRNMTSLDFAEITKSTPEKSLVVSLKKNSGRNNQGKITEDYLVYGVTKDFIREHMDICGCSLQELYEICEENGCVLIQAHPFREYCQIQNPKYLHGVERNFNSGHDNHNEKLDAWLKEPGREHLIITRGSDCHEIPQVGLVDFVVDEDVRDSRELAEVLRKLA